MVRFGVLRVDFGGLLEGGGGLLQLAEADVGVAHAREGDEVLRVPRDGLPVLFGGLFEFPLREVGGREVVARVGVFRVLERLGAQGLLGHLGHARRNRRARLRRP